MESLKKSFDVNFANHIPITMSIFHQVYYENLTSRQLYVSNTTNGN